MWDLTTAGTNLYAFGVFTTVNGKSAPRIARFRVDPRRGVQASAPSETSTGAESNRRFGLLQSAATCLSRLSFSATHIAPSHRQLAATAEITAEAAAVYSSPSVLSPLGTVQALRYRPVGHVRATPPSSRPVHGSLPGTRVPVVPSDGQPGDGATIAAAEGILYNC